MYIPLIILGLIGLLYTYMYQLINSDRNYPLSIIISPFYILTTLSYASSSAVRLDLYSWEYLFPRFIGFIATLLITTKDLMIGYTFYNTFSTHYINVINILQIFGFWFLSLSIVRTWNSIEYTQLINQDYLII